MSVGSPLNKDFFGERFTLCYKTEPTSNLWTCESGYKSIYDVDGRAKEIRSIHNEAMTTIFPYNNCTPNMVQQVGIKGKLKPMIIVKNKS